MRRILSTAALVALTASVASAAPTFTATLTPNASAPAGTSTYIITYTNPGVAPMPRIELVDATITAAGGIRFADDGFGGIDAFPLAANSSQGARQAPTGTFFALATTQGIGVISPESTAQNATSVRYVLGASANAAGYGALNSFVFGGVVLNGASASGTVVGEITIGVNKFPLNLTLGGVVTPDAAFAAGTLGGSDARQSLATTGDNPTIYTLTIDFGNLASVPANFSVDTNMTNGGTIATVGALPSGITAAASGDVISGTVNGSLRGSFDIALTGSTPGADSAILRIVAIPEPATLSVLAGVGMLALRRRK